MTTRKLLFILMIALDIMPICIKAQNETVISRFFSNDDDTDSISNTSYSVKSISNVIINNSVGYNNKFINQPYEIYLNTGLDEKRINLYYSVYSQTKDDLNLKIEENAYSFLKFAISTMDGKLLMDGIIKDINTIISMPSFTNGAYILSVLQESKKLKSFIIIKN